jgi:hypothetical protein
VQEPERLLIDHAAAAAPPSDAAVTEWAVEQRVFISSVIVGYEDFRVAAAEGIQALGGEPVLFERFGGRDGDPTAAYLNEVRSCDIYVGLLGEKYGRPLPSRFSATHEEYREAERHGLRLSVWAQGGVDREGHQQSFLEEIREFNVTGGYTTPEDLKAGLVGRLRDIAAEDLSPWVKLGNVIFRAREITEGGGEIQVKSAVKSPDVAQALHELRDPFTRRRTTLTYAGRSLGAQVKEVETTTRAARSQQFTIGAQVAELPAPTTFSVSGQGWDDLTETAIRVSVLGEESPDQWATGLDLPNPFAALAAASVSEEALRPIAELLLHEALAVHRGVVRMRLRLGPSIAGKRAFRVEFLPRAHYSDETPEMRMVTGFLRL